MGRWMEEEEAFIWAGGWVGGRGTLGWVGKDVAVGGRRRVGGWLREGGDGKGRGDAERRVEDAVAHAGLDFGAVMLDALAERVGGWVGDNR